MSLESAKVKLSAGGFPYKSLPQDMNAMGVSMWNKIEKQYKLEVPELAALQLDVHSKKAKTGSAEGRWETWFNLPFRRGVGSVAICSMVLTPFREMMKAQKKVKTPTIKKPKKNSKAKKIDKKMDKDNTKRPGGEAGTSSSWTAKKKKKTEKTEVLRRRSCQQGKSAGKSAGTTTRHGG